ncbi:MAG: S16 family serine protease, partial [Candidatus Micrarchaeia archaeon]
PYISVDTQESARVAVFVAAREAGVDASRYDVLYRIVADAEVVDGPSGGAALALLAYSEFTGQKPRSDMAVTGTIERDGSIGKISGVEDKLSAVAEKGLKLFVVPQMQSKQGGVDLAAAAFKEWGLQVAEARNLGELIALAYTPTGSAVNASAFELPPFSVEALEASPFGEAFAAVVEAQRAKLALTPGHEAELNDSALLLENGYYYSAANVVFLALVEADAQAFENANYSHAEINAKFEELKNEINAFEPTQENAANWEWVQGGRARLTWALLTVEDALNYTADGDYETAAADYASAVGWLGAARAFNEVALAEAGVPAANGSLRELAEEALAEAEEVAAAAAGLDYEIGFHARAAREAFDEGAYSTSLFDSCFVTSFYQADAAFMDVLGTDLEELEPSFAGLDAYKGSLWADLYYRHALYDLQEANRTGEFYYTETAVKLAFLADCLDARREQIQSVYPGGPSPSPAIVVTAEVTQSGGLPGWALAGLAACLVLFVAAFILAKRPETAQTDKERLARLDDLLSRGKISWETYARLSAKCAPPKAKKTRKTKKR